MSHMNFILHSLSQRAIVKLVHWSSRVQIRNNIQSCCISCFLSCTYEMCYFTAVSSNYIIKKDAFPLQSLLQHGGILSRACNGLF